MRNPIYFFGIFALIGLPCLVLALYFTYSAVRDNASYEQAEGTITDFNGSGYPDISFTHQGQTYTFHSNYQSSDMQTGDVVTVAFPPGNPGDASIKDFSRIGFSRCSWACLVLCLGESASEAFISS